MLPAQNSPQRYIPPKDYIEAQYLERTVLKYSNLTIGQDLDIFDAIIPHPTK